MSSIVESEQCGGTISQIDFHLGESPVRTRWLFALILGVVMLMGAANAVLADEGGDDPGHCGHKAGTSANCNRGDHVGHRPGGRLPHQRGRHPQRLGSRADVAAAAPRDLRLHQ
jgi:hypothetical protein